jgi:hypothetical protein
MALGSAVGAFAVAAPSDAARVPRIRVLHAAPAFARADSALELGATTLCDRPSAPACRVSAAFASVGTGESSGWTRVRGLSSSGGYRFSIPGSLVGSTGLDYRLAFRTADGGTTTYPPSGVPLHVSSTDGLATGRVAGAFSWKRVRSPDRRELFLPYGDRRGEVGTEGGGSGQDLLGPSSFAVDASGGISVVDWVNDRVEVFRGGEIVRIFATPAHRTFDLASGTAGRSYLLTLGSDGTAFELSPNGEVVGRYAAAFGVPSSVATTTTGPAVLVGPSQWLAVRSSVGVARSSRSQAATVTASPVDRSGSSTRFGIVDGRHVALTWMRADGSNGGTLLALPEGARPGTEYFAQPLRDGGALLALGLWNESHNGVGLFRLSSTGSVRSFSLLPEPSTRADARASTVRFVAPDRVLVAHDHRHGMSIDAFEVGGR